MTSYPYVEDYLEIIAGKKAIAGAPNPPLSLFGWNFAPIINLARYDNSFLDSVTDTTKNGEALTDKQADLAVKLVLKYRRQLAAHGINTDTVLDPKFRKSLRIVDRTRSITLVGESIHIKFPYDTKLIDQIKTTIKESQGSTKYNRDLRVWQSGLTEFNVNWICEFGRQHNFIVDPIILGWMERIVQCEKQGYEICLELDGDRCVIRNAKDSLVEYIETHLGGFELNNIVRLVDWASILGYTVDPALANAVAMDIGPSGYLLLENREYDFKDAPDAVERVINYARLTNRWPIVAFNPTPENTLNEWQRYLEPNEILVLGNKKETMVDLEPHHKLIFTHRALRQLENIPILFSHVGMMIGSDKMIMMSRSNKVFYSSMKLK
jgi:hypothetical protein